MQFVFLLEQIVNGLVLGGYYLLIALGLSLIFSIGGVVNLAHSAFYALGAYIAVEANKYVGFWPSVVISPLAVALLGIGFERFFLRRFYTAGRRQASPIRPALPAWERAHKSPRRGLGKRALRRSGAMEREPPRHSEAGLGTGAGARNP